MRRFGRSGPVKLGAAEGLDVLGVGYGALPAETAELLAPPLRDQPSQFGILVVGEIQKRRLRAPFLALKQQRYERRQQRQRGDRFEFRYAQHHAQALSLGSIADLI